MNNIAFKQLELVTLLEITNTLIEHEDVDDLLQDILIRTLNFGRVLWFCLD